MQRETLFKLRIRPRLEKIPKSEWIKTQMRSVRGIPDFIGAVASFAVFLELKTEDGEAEQLQLRRLWRLQRTGAYCAIVDPTNVDAIIEDLTRLSKGEVTIHDIQSQKFDPGSYARSQQESRVVANRRSRKVHKAV